MQYVQKKCQQNTIWVCGYAMFIVLPSFIYFQIPSNRINVKNKQKEPTLALEFVPRTHFAWREITAYGL